MTRKYLFAILFIVLVGFLVFPQNASADVQLSNYDAHLLLNSVQQELVNEWINLTTSPGLLNQEKQAALFLIRNAIQEKELRYAFVELPKEYLKNLLGIAILLAGSPDVGTILDKIEKESVKKAISIVTEWLLQNEIKVDSGTLTYSFTSYRGNPQSPVFYYNLTYRPLTGKEGELLVEFYSPEEIEPQKPTIVTLGLNVASWEFDKWLAAGNEKIDPFIIRVKGRVSEGIGGGYHWVEPTVEITFSEPVPKLSVEEPLSFWEKVKKFFVDLFTQQIQNVLRFDPFTPAAVVETQLIEGEESETEELLADAEQEVLEEPEIEIELTDEEIQEILDSISETIEEDNEEVEEETIEETEEVEETTEEEPEEETSTTICETTSGSSPVRDKIIINEVAWMGTVENYNDEWIELKNISGSEINLAGWQLLNKEKQIKIVFEKGIVLAGGFYLLERADDSVLNVTADFIYSGSLSNTEEALYLFDGNCQLQDEVSATPDWPAGDNGSKRTMERKSNLSWQTSSNPGGTPKAGNSEGYHEYYGGGSSPSPPPSDTESPVANAGLDQVVEIKEAITLDASDSTDNFGIVSYQWDIDGGDGLDWNSPDLEGLNPTWGGYSATGTYMVTLLVSDEADNTATDTLTITVNSPPKILITEIQIAGEGDEKEEFVELYNSNETDVGLDGWYIQRKTEDASDYSTFAPSALFSEKTIKAKDYFLVARQDSSFVGLADIITTYPLTENNTLVLKNQNGIKIDEVSWGEIPVGLSYGRVWDESAQEYLDDFELQIPTPKAKNQPLPLEEPTSPELTYLPAIGHNNPGMMIGEDEYKWEDESLAYDDNTDTFAKVWTFDWHNSPWLELLAPPKQSQGIRFWLGPWVNYGIHPRIEFFYDKDWHFLTEWREGKWQILEEYRLGAIPPKGEWIEIDYPEEIVEKARIMFGPNTIGSRGDAQLHEFQFKTYE